VQSLAGMLVKTRARRLDAEFAATFYESDVSVSPFELLDGLYGSVDAAVVDDDDLEIVSFPVFLEGFD